MRTGASGLIIVRSVKARNPRSGAPVRRAPAGRSSARAAATSSEKTISLQKILESGASAPIVNSTTSPSHDSISRMSPGNAPRRAAERSDMTAAPDASTAATSDPTTCSMAGLGSNAATAIG